MAKGILAQAQARLPANMGGSQGAVRDVPASFTGGQGQSLGIFQPKKGGGGGGGGIKLGPKKPSQKLMDEYKKNIAEVKDALAKSVSKGYITNAQAENIFNQTNQLMKDALEGNIKGTHADLEKVRALGDNSIVETASNLVDYLTAKQIQANGSVNVVTGKTLPNINTATGETAEQAIERAKQEALNAGDWAKAEEFGAGESEIIARGGILTGTQVVQEGPESRVVNVWETDKNFTPASTDYSYDGDTLHLGDDQFSTSQLEERTSWDEGYDDFSVDEFLSTDTSGGFADYYSADPSFDYETYHDTATYSDTDSWSDDAGYGVGNKGGVIRKAGGGNVTVDP